MLGFGVARGSKIQHDLAQVPEFCFRGAPIIWPSYYQHRPNSYSIPQISVMKQLKVWGERISRSISPGRRKRAPPPASADTPSSSNVPVTTVSTEATSVDPPAPPTTTPSQTSPPVISPPTPPAEKPSSRHLEEGFSSALKILDLVDKCLDGCPIWGPKAAISAAAETIRNFQVCCAVLPRARPDEV